MDSSPRRLSARFPRMRPRQAGSHNQQRSRRRSDSSSRIASAMKRSSGMGCGPPDASLPAPPSSVATYGGMSSITLTAVLRNWWRRDRVQACTAALVAQYTGKRATGTNAKPDDTFTSVAEGWVPRCGRNASATRMGPSRLVSISRVTSASSTSPPRAKFGRNWMPALLKMQFSDGNSAPLAGPPRGWRLRPSHPVGSRACPGSNRTSRSGVPHGAPR